MGKKGTKRKTKWRALPLGEEAGGFGNEEDLHDEDQSTTSSGVTGQPTNISYKRQSFYNKMAEKPFRPTRRFTYDRIRSKEPLIKLESKTFDEEEYTKITTPRQDVLFKKGYFGRKRESSVEETTPSTGEMDSEEPIMDQIIITNGFVDERGHYLVNGNSYEIYDPYSNTVTVVVGPPPYANGVTQPVLAAVSCQPVPLQPVDWYPPGADWPSQGSAWTPSYPKTPHSDSVSTPDGPTAFSSPNAQIPSLYNHPAYVVPGYAYGESPALNGVPLQMNPPPETLNSDENKVELQKTLRNSTESVEGEETAKPKQEPEDEVKAEETRESPDIAQNILEAVANPPPQIPACEVENTQVPQRPTDLRLAEPKQVEKQSHSTQTYLLDATQHSPKKPPCKKSHSTQTPPEETFVTDKMQEKNNKIVSDVPLSSEGETKPTWKQTGNRFVYSSKKIREDSSRKSCQQHLNFLEKKPHVNKPDSSPMKVSYAKKAMSGFENGNPEFANGKIVNGKSRSFAPVVNGIRQMLTTNETNNANNAKPLPRYEDKTNGFVKTRFNRGNNRGINGAEQTNQKYKDRKLELKQFNEPEKKLEETTESRSPSVKSSTVSELSSPTELSSGQNTPPEKHIVQKMEEEINRSFEEKLKQNLTKTETETVNEEGDAEEKTEEKPKEKKKKKNKVKRERKSSKDTTGRGNKKKKKRAEEEAKEKSESENSSEEIPFLLSTWGELKDEGQDFISDVDSLLNGEKEILKSLGLNNDKTSYSKLPLHSDLLVMLPTFGWGRPKLKIEDFFAPAPYRSDLFTKRNITNMKSTKPEEFFASVVDGPITDKTDKKKEPQKKPSKTEETSTFAKKNQKTGYKTSKKKTKQSEEEKKPETEAEAEAKDGKLGIVEAVNSWLQEQDDTEKFISVESFENLMTKDEKAVSKNAESNPLHARSRDEDGASVADFREGGGCKRVANVISDGFMHASREFSKEKKNGRMYRSSSWDAKLSEVKIKKHLKFLTDSASFCQDLISDVRNGLPTGSEFATEELCDPKQTVIKYYTLAPNGRLRSESDSENEVFDALEYKFLTKENQETDGKSPDGNGNASITDSGVHSDMESSEDNPTDQQKEATCKLQ